MKKRLFSRLMISLVLWFGGAAAANAQVRVFACEPEWGGLASAIGGDDVEISVGVTAAQDPHYIRAKPSLIAAVRQSQLVICTGAELEVGWLPLLIERGGGSDTRPGGKGYLMAADYVTLIEKPALLSRAEGDVHPEGNPHLHLNPHNLLPVARQLAQRLSEIDPAKSASYQGRLDEFERRMQQSIPLWEARAKSLRGTRVVVHHRSLSYLASWLGLELVGTLEPKPGVPPTASHLDSLLSSLRSVPPAMILRTPYDPVDAGQWLSEKIGVPVRELPYTVGGNADSSDIFALFESTLGILLESPRDGARG